MFLALLTAASAAPNDLCDVLEQRPVPMDVIAQALGAGADPNARCTRTVTVRVGPSFSAFEVIFGILVPPVGLAMLLGAEGHEEQRTVQVAPLELAISLRDPVLAKALLEGGADPLLPPLDQGQRPLQTAVVQDLALGGAVWTSLLLEGAPRVPADLLEREPLALDALLARPDLLQPLLQRGLDPEGRDHRGETWLVRAIHGGKPLQVEAALAAGADPNLRLGGRTPIGESVHRNRLDLLPMLIAAGGDPKKASSGGESLVTVAVREGDLAMVEALLGVGLPATLGGAGEPEVGRAPLSAAVERGRLDLVRVLAAAGARPIDDEAWQAADAGNLELLDLVLDLGADPNVMEGFGRRPLHEALDQQDEQLRLALVERLLEAGADPSRSDVSVFGDGPPINAVIASGDLPMLQVLLPHVPASRRGLLLLQALGQSNPVPELVEVIAQPMGQAELDALLVSAQYSYQEPARAWLRARGARYPADCLAELLPDAEISTIEAALSDGARLDVPDTRGSLPADLALERGDAAIVALLVERGARLSEPVATSVFSRLLWERDLARLELALSLGARPTEQDIRAIAYDSQHHLLRRMAEPDMGLPMSTWRPWRYWGLDPGTQQVIREIWADQKAARKAARKRH